jgi:hypothetical protein
MTLRQSLSWFERSIVLKRWGGEYWKRNFRCSSISR